MKIGYRASLASALIMITTFVVAAQTKGKTVKKTTTKAPATAAPTPTEEVQPPTGSKRNERPEEKGTIPTAVRTPAEPIYEPVYFYEFTRPGFIYQKIVIEHDEAGKGTILFERDGSYEPVTDPIQLSAASLEKIKGAFTALNFLDSSETYQTERDYSHMGNVMIRVKRDGRSREVRYNWSDKKEAKLLVDEYRRIGNEYTWRFEMMSARENQPLLTPGLVDALDSYLKRKEISDPTTLVPFLTKLSTDERLPLMARNHIGKLLAQIEKSAKK